MERQWKGILIPCRVYFLNQFPGVYLYHCWEIESVIVSVRGRTPVIAVQFLVEYQWHFKRFKPGNIRSNASGLGSRHIV